MNLEEIKDKVASDNYVYSLHAEVEARADDLTFAEVEEALVNGQILEEYPDTGRGESCLVVGFAGAFSYTEGCRVLSAYFAENKHHYRSVWLVVVGGGGPLWAHGGCASSFFPTP